jgi:riboflavin synthase
MFTGIIECLGTISSIEKEGDNFHFWVKSAISNELKIDQSLAHNGVCLTVVELKDDMHKVTAIQETLDKTNLGDLRTGDIVNLERAMKFGGRIDGHLVQGHVDCVAICTEAITLDGSWTFSFLHPSEDGLTTVPKGSICINGVSLTVVDSAIDSFSVAIIPYTFENTHFKNLKKGDKVNLEFDIIGKYLWKYQQAYQAKK